MTLLERLLRRSRFTKLEARLLDELKAHLAPDAKRIVSAQLDAVNLVQRTSDTREVRLYCMKDRRVDWNAVTPLSVPVKELRFATIKFSMEGAAAKITADFLIVNGYLSFIEFDNTVRSVLNRDNIVIHSVMIHQNPLRPFQEPAQALTVPSTVPLRGWLDRLSQNHSVTNFSPALAAEDRQRLAKFYGTIFPDEYLELVSQTEGCVIENCSISGLANLQEIELGGIKYLVLGQSSTANFIW